MKLDIKKRSPEQTSAIVAYLKKVSVHYRKLDQSLLEALIEKLQPVQFRKGEVILKQDEAAKPQEDDVQVIVLEGSVSKVKQKKNFDGKVLDSIFIKRYGRDQVISDDVIGKSLE